MKLNEVFLDNMKKMLGSEFENFKKSYLENPAEGLRIQKFKISEHQLFEEFGKMITGKILWSENGYYYDIHQAEQALKLGNHPWHIGGAFYIQEPSAQLSAELLDVQPEDYVLDLCAAPGGKSTQIGAHLGEKGFLLSNEIVKKRASILLSNLERMGIRNFCVTSNHPKELEKVFVEYFDKIMVDAPCSGEGMFKREENAASEYKDDTPEFCAKRQTEILESAAKMLRRGGRMVYSTCTFSVLENEGVIETFLKIHPDFHLVQTAFENPYTQGELRKTIRLMPHKVQGEGHFATVLERDGHENIVRERNNTNSAESKGFFEFAAQYLKVQWSGIKVYDGNVYAMPYQMKQLEKCNVVGKGLYLGQNLKNRFVPSHALCTALTPQQIKNSLEINQEQLKKYLHGETLQADVSDGWGTICYKGVNVGWYKAVGGILKNHFPKGLRILGV